MAKSEAVKLARIQSDKELLLAAMRNPVVELIAGIAAITYLNKGSQSWLESITGVDLAAGGEYAGLIAIIGLQQVAPLIPAIVGGYGDVSKALPAVLALGAAVK